MTDELVKRYDVYPAYHGVDVEECHVGEFVYYADHADRIEQLTAERDVAIRWWGEATELVRQARLQYSDEKARAEKAEAENARLRGALEGLLTLVEHANFEEGWCCCGDDMLHHQSPMDCGHTPVDMGEYHASLAIKKARAALKGETP